MQGSIFPVSKYFGKPSRFLLNSYYFNENFNLGLKTKLFLTGTFKGNLRARFLNHLFKTDITLFPIIYVTDF